MIHRRSFLKQSLFSLGSVAIAERLNAISTPGSKKSFPVVIATWDNRKATATAWEILQTGGRALDALEAGIRIPEADPEDTSVGYGGFPDRDGVVTLDACIMDEYGNTGAVLCLEEIMHPISVARRVLERTPHVMLAGKGAQRFALEEGFIRENLLTETARAAYEKWKITAQYKPVINSERHDTIGMVAYDKQGRIAGGCSTSGMAFKMSGRIGDSPIIGSGMYTDNAYGGAAATGLGELVVKGLTTFLTVEEMRRGAHPVEAARKAIKRLLDRYPEQARSNQVGIVAVDRQGRTGGFSIQPGFNYAVYQNGHNRVIEAESFL